MPELLRVIPPELEDTVRDYYVVQLLSIHFISWKLGIQKPVVSAFLSPYKKEAEDRRREKKTASRSVVDPDWIG